MAGSSHDSNTQRRTSGFTLIELLVATAVTVTVIGGAVILFAHSVQTSNLSLKHSEVQTEARAALTQISRDLSQAGTGVPLNGIAIPSVATGGADPNFACDTAQCYTGDDPAYTQGLLYKVTPGRRHRSYHFRAERRDKDYLRRSDAGLVRVSGGDHRSRRQQPNDAAGDDPRGHRSSGRRNAGRRHSPAERLRLGRRCRHSGGRPERLLWHRSTEYQSAGRGGGKHQVAGDAGFESGDVPAHAGFSAR